MSNNDSKQTIKAQLGQVVQLNQFGPAQSAHLILSNGVEWSACCLFLPFEELAVNPWTLPHYSLPHQLLTPPNGS